MEKSEDFDKSFVLLQELVDFQAVDELFPRRSNAVYTTCVVLWMLVYQRLKPDASMETAVKHLLDTYPSYLPKNKRTTDRKVSSNTAAYSRARKDLPLEVAEWFAKEVSEGIISSTEPGYGNRRVFLIDGTTIPLAPEKELQISYPPSRNQHGEGVWPIALMTVFHELSSGVALLPQVGPMYGEQAVSESELARQGMAQLPVNSIVMSDTGFGIFGPLYAAVECGHDVVSNMKESNFNSLRRIGEEISQSKRHKSYRVTWKPTAKNRKTLPDLPEDASIDVYLHEYKVSEKLKLHLVTTLEEKAAAVAELFKSRYDVEVDIRNLKVVMGTEEIRAKSKGNFLKELYTSVVAYNLTCQLRREAAKLEGVAPRRMSFKRIWTTFQTFLLRHMHDTPSKWREAFETALKIARKDKLPNRPNRKSPREAYTKRPKNTQFAKRKKPDSKNIDPSNGK